MRNSVQIAWFLITCLIVTDSTIALAQQAVQPFTVKDDIELAHFGDNPIRAVRFSPDSNYFAVYAERGRLDLDRCESSLRFYRSEDVKDFLKKSDGAKLPVPVWVVSLATSKKCSTINDWRWLANSSGVAFLQRGQDDTQTLVLADLTNRTVAQLSSSMDAVKAFDIRDRQNFVYTATDPTQRQKSQAERREPLIVGTGRDFYHLFFPDTQLTANLIPHVNLWAVVGGRRFQVKNQSVPLAFAEGALALSPDGRTLVTMLPVRDVPLSWETLYPPSDIYPAFKFHTGHQELELNYYTVLQYVCIELETGAVRTLIDAPSSAGVGWWTQGDPSWSSDGTAILLPGTFLSSERQAPSLPCVAVVDLLSSSITCIERLKNQSTVTSMNFVSGDKHRASVTFYEKDWGAREYQQSSAGEWRLAEQITKPSEAVDRGFELAVKQSLNETPRLVATSKQISRVILDPNPQLRDRELGSAGVYTWKVKDGSIWRGGLYKPRHYEPGKRYPLVIQTHGFQEQFYRPSGGFHTAFAARALAATGIMVLQVQEHCPMNSPEEAPCAASGYEAAASELVSRGLVDPEKIGIIGFSHTCLYVMETLTRNPLRVKAAAITDGIMADYNQYLMSDSESARYYDKLIGARPIGQGLQTWLERSPGFKLERVGAALLVVGEGPESLLSMWQPYAILHLLGKPVELVMLNTDEHDLSNPAVRLASQGGSVDWFRFWLKDEEDPDPAKTEQYIRWRDLRKMLDNN